MITLKGMVPWVKLSLTLQCYTKIVFKSVRPRMCSMKDRFDCCSLPDSNTPKANSLYKFKNSSRYCNQVYCLLNANTFLVEHFKKTIFMRRYLSTKIIKTSALKSRPNEDFSAKYRLLLISYC